MASLNRGKRKKRNDNIINRMKNVHAVVSRTCVRNGGNKM